MHRSRKLFTLALTLILGFWAGTALACPDRVQTDVENLDNGVRVTRTVVDSEDGDLILHMQEGIQARFESDSFFENHGGLVDVVVEIENLDSGVQLTLTSENLETVTRLQEFHADGGHGAHGGGGCGSHGDGNFEGHGHGGGHGDGGGQEDGHACAHAGEGGAGESGCSCGNGSE